MSFVFGSGSERLITFTSSSRYWHKSLEEWRWEFYSEFSKDTDEGKEGSLVKSYIEREFSKDLDLQQVSLPSSTTTTIELERNNNGEETSYSNQISVGPTEVSDHYEFYMNEIYSDFTIRFKQPPIIDSSEVNLTNKTTLPVHKIILASYSEYFRNLFSLGMIESTSNELEIDTLEDDEKLFRNMILCVYSPKYMQNLTSQSCETMLIMFDKYGFDIHKKTLMDTLLSKSDSFVAEFLFRCNNNEVLCDIVKKDLVHYLITIMNRCFKNERVAFSNILIDLVCTYVSQSYISEFDVLVFAKLMQGFTCKAVSFEQDEWTELIILANKRFGHFSNFRKLTQSLQ